MTDLVIDVCILTWGGGYGGSSQPGSTPIGTIVIDWDLWEDSIMQWNIVIFYIEPLSYI